MVTEAFGEREAPVPSNLGFILIPGQKDVLNMRWELVRPLSEDLLNEFCEVESRAFGLDDKIQAQIVALSYWQTRLWSWKVLAFLLFSG